MLIKVQNFSPNPTETSKDDILQPPKMKSSNLDEFLVPNPGWNSQKPPLGSINTERYDLKWPSVP